MADIPLFQPTPKCSECQGKCCKTLPGSWYPQDIPGGPTVENVVAFVRSGRACFDWWEGDPRKGHDELERGLFLRPRTVGGPFVIDPSWGGTCVYLQSFGCSLQWDERPTGCRALKPIEKECVNHAGDKSSDAVAWLTLGTLLEDAIAICEEELCDAQPA